MPEHLSGPVITSFLDPLIDGIQLERVIVLPSLPLGRIHAVCIASVPQSLSLFPTAGLDWQKGTLGALNLAGVILDVYLPPRTGDVATYQGRLIPCRQLVADLAVRFAAEVLAQVPYWGGIILRSDVMDWLEPHLADAGEPLIDLAAMVPGEERVP
jgi:hypothetical protein